jgi:hypothetical protein
MSCKYKENTKKFKAKFHSKITISPKNNLEELSQCSCPKEDVQEIKIIHKIQKPTRYLNKSKGIHLID